MINVFAYIMYMGDYRLLFENYGVSLALTLLFEYYLRTFIL